MKYSIKIPVNVFQESECIKNHKEIFKECGKKAFIVTGKHSARACGALNDIEEVLKIQDIEYEIFDEIENNPSLETVSRASDRAKKFGADFVIGIGGGSPLDASKAIAVIAAGNIEPIEIFKMEFKKALPIIAIPTTSGTGSEVTPYSVLLRKDLKTKVSFGNKYTFAKYALLDSKYTESLRIDTTIDTAIDAFTHSFEGYLSNRATPITDAFAIEGIKNFADSIKQLKSYYISEDIREKLMYASMIGGIVIAHTGVTIVHGMGYCYTYFKGIAHGKANGFLTKNYIDYIYDVKKEKIDNVLNILGCKDVLEFESLIEKLIGKAPKITDEEIEMYTSLTMLQTGSIKNTARELSKNDIKSLWASMNK
ncbi:iron-containing alcohol dehydrogenase family protein [Clostridium sp. BJN0001]|uniref:iron-containing alcohol dehydrogenase family protein n=1 Tax=Clostridium sp. BJN0001 TaxID=2930219 RepID=UPI001FD1DAB4|nr:iron-containing alcohol dehydrogenase family protein [Clostridium sp. BJN0001]